MTADLYETLGVERQAAGADIKRAFRKRAKATHPDAGGTADEFDRVNRAYVVLIDPDRRAEYDQTGNVDEKVDNSHVEALTILQQMMDHVIEQVGDVVSIDVVAEMRNSMDKRIAEIERDMAQRRKKVRRLERFAGKFRKADGENVLRKMVDAKIGNIQCGIDSGEKAISGIRKALALLDGYSFDADPEQPRFGPTIYSTAGSTSTCAA